METLRTIQNEINGLHQRGLIDMYAIQKWIFITIISFGTLSYVWNWTFKNDPGISHFPPELLPPEILKKYQMQSLYHSENEARSTVVREVEFAIIACVGDDNTVDEVASSAFRLMKSAAMSTKMIIRFHIFTEDALYLTLMNELDRWPLLERHHVSFKFRHATFPEAMLSWRNLEKTCSSFRLFLPTLLRDVNHVLYIDIDAVLLSPLDSLWESLNIYNESQVISIPPSIPNFNENRIGGDGKCIIGTTKVNTQNNLKMPNYFGENGLNSGVILFDNFKLQHALFRIPTKLKDSCGDCETVIDYYETTNMTWNPHMLRAVYELFKDNITTPDHDILNIVFAFNPDKLHLLSCGYNYHWSYGLKSNFFRNMIERKIDSHYETNSQCNHAQVVHCDQTANPYFHPEISELKSIFDEAKFGEIHSINERIKKLVSSLQKKLTYSNDLYITQCALHNAKTFLNTYSVSNFYMW